MKKVILLSILISASLISVGCSSKNVKEEQKHKEEIEIVKDDKRLEEVNKDKKKKAELESVLGVVVEVSEESEFITVQSKQRNVLGPIISVKKVNGNKDFEFFEGDLVRLYYSVSNGSFDNFSILDLEYAELIGYNKEDKIDYYKYPILTVSSGGKTIKLSEKNSALTHDLINKFSWTTERIEGFKADHQVMNDDEMEFEFDSKKGILYDPNYKIWVQFDEYFSSVLKSALKNE